MTVFVFVGFDSVLPVPPVVRFWAWYEELYGGVHEELLARRNGYANAAEMRQSKFEEWRREQGMSEERADGHYWILRRLDESAPWSTVPEIAELRTHESHVLADVRVPRWRGFHCIGGDAIVDDPKYVRVVSQIVRPPYAPVSDPQVPPASPSRSQNDTAWLIERNGIHLCLSVESRWVGFTDPRAWRFSTREDAERLIREKGIGDVARAESHGWMSGAPPAEPASAIPTPEARAESVDGLASLGEEALAAVPILARYPHCDSLVLHPHGSCEYCDIDEFAPLHEWRRAHGINYTGENDPSKKPCPAEARRPAETINRWPGNRATPAREAP